MSTVDKKIADEIIAGKYEEDNCTTIIVYTNKWGGESYGCLFNNQPNKYVASEFVRNPRVYWTKVQ